MPRRGTSSGPVSAALAMRAANVDDNRKLALEGVPPAAVGIGIQSGPGKQKAASLARDGPDPCPRGRRDGSYLETRVSMYSKLPPLSVPLATSELPSADSFSSQAVSTLPPSHRPAQPFWSSSLLDSVSAPVVAL
jgi:hypothetical protein